MGRVFRPGPIVQPRVDLLQSPDAGKSGWMAAILPLLAFSMALGAQPPKDWTGLRRFFRQQVADAGIVGASLVIVREGKIEGEEVRRAPGRSHAPAGRSRHDLSLGVDHEDVHRRRDHAAARSRAAVARRSGRQVRARAARGHNPFGDISQVTIRHLMSHSAGFRAGTWPWGGDQAVASVRADGVGAARRDDAVHRDSSSSRAASTATRTRASSFSAASSSCSPATTTRCTSTRTSSCRSG